MYSHEWDAESGGYILMNAGKAIAGEVRPVFREELALLRFDTDHGWLLPNCKGPLMWAEGRKYYYFGECLAEVVGGGLSISPEVKVFKTDLEIRPVKMPLMLAKNRETMAGMEQRALEYIYNTYKHYRSKVDTVYVAFSGGKDSVVVLDLVQRALPHDEFRVVFGDTTMEYSYTYVTLEESQTAWPSLEWITARAPIDSMVSWETFGPPSRTIRWCCGVHKTAPSLEAIKGKDQSRLGSEARIRALAYLGIRADESEARSAYGMLSNGSKHSGQVSCHPIYEWNTGEIFLYIFMRGLPLNKLYRYGAHRVGCLVCPMSSQWSEFISSQVSPNEIAPYLSTIRQQLNKDISSDKDWGDYLSQGGWKNRASGKLLREPENKVLEIEDEVSLTLVVRDSNMAWDTWMLTFAEVAHMGAGEFNIRFKDIETSFTAEPSPSGVKLRLTKPARSGSAARFLSLFKSAVYKAAYCVQCGICVAECPSGAIKRDHESFEFNQCSGCHKCLEVAPRGCMVAKSKMSVGDGRNSMRNIDRYRTFGFRLEWIDLYIEDTRKFWDNERMGEPMLKSFSVWAREAGMLGAKNAATGFVNVVARLGSKHPLVWAYFFTNLAYNSSLFRWYVETCEYGVRYESDDLMSMLGEGLKPRTKRNALTSLKATLSGSPLGDVLGQAHLELKGKTVIAITRMGWIDPNPIAVLYALYRFAEERGGLFSLTIADVYSECTGGGISPARLFGISQDSFREIIIGLSRDYPSVVSINLNKDLLQDIYLNRDLSSAHIAALFEEAR